MPHHVSPEEYEDIGEAVNFIEQESRKAAAAHDYAMKHNISWMRQVQLPSPLTEKAREAEKILKEAGI